MSRGILRTQGRFVRRRGLGDSDKAIGTVDESGVALAAIQGLNQKLEATEKTLREKDAKIQDLQARLEKLERLVNAKNGAGR